MEVLSGRVLLRPIDPERSRAFNRDILGLAVSRQFGSGPERGTVFFLGGGLLELSGRAADAGYGVVAAGARAGRGRNWASVACGSCGSRPGSHGGW
jgi:hypothetical protein